MKAKKKILHIVESFGGGVFSMLCDLLNGMSSEYDIVVAYAKRKQTPDNFQEYFNKDIKFIEIENFTRNISISKDLKALREIKKIYKQEKPDIVHLHSSKAGILGRIGIHGNKIKMFYNPHGFSFLKKDDSRIKRLVYWLIEKCTAVLNHKCTIIGCSQGEFEEAKKLNKNAICINNGISIKKIEEETKDLKEKEFDANNFKICTVGRISFQKNPEMFNKIAETFPDNQFTWIGEGDLKDKLTSHNIKVTGWKTREEVLQILSNNDIFLLPSLWEGLPISLLEAMYMKKICIVSDVIGNRDVIINEKNGFICKNIKEYNETIKNLKTQKKYEKISKQAHHDVCKLYSVSEMIAGYKNIYEG